MEQHLIDLFTGVVGKDNFFLDPGMLDDAAKTNYRTSQSITAIIKPANAQEISDCLAIANEQHIAVYPVSKGKNWGYGSRVPLKDKSILIELDRLNGIIDYNEKFGYVTVEPGVTFQQLFDFLREKRSTLIISITGSSGDSSVIGNVLERGIGTGLYADRFSVVCGFHVVLPTGETIATGFERFDDSAIAGKLYRWGSGPSIDGLFSQSNLGIVTRMTVWLMKCPEHFQLLFYSVNDQKLLPPLMDEMRELALDGIIRPTVTLYNEFRTFSSMTQYPWKKCTPGINTSDEVIKALREGNPYSDKVGKWNGEISIRAMSKQHADVQSALIRDRLGKYIDNFTVVDLSKEQTLEKLAEHFEGKFSGHGSDLITSYLQRKYIGIPDNLAIRQSYWRKRKSIPEQMNPDVDKCGIIWICPIVPFDGGHVEKAIEIISKTAEKYYFEPAISLQCMSERAINIIGSINWDREIEGEDQSAEQCYIEAVALLKKNGYFSYRNTTFGMMAESDKTDGQQGYYHFLNSIKKAIDPNNILAPGRYNVG